jgi:formamidopyrimidine-DNA glycosylase
MPELPDIQMYVEALTDRIVGSELESVRLASPFLLRSVDPPLAETHGRLVREVRRLGKRIVIELDGEYFLVIHLMVAGRLKWLKAGAAVPKKQGLAAFDFETGTLLLTEAGSKKRVSLHVVLGAQGLADHDRGGFEPLGCELQEFSASLALRNHTLKRALCDPTLFSGIGNAYSDEILHAARLSPFKQTSSMSEEETERLWVATRETLDTWIKRFRDETGDGFPGKVTAFRPEMAVHGKYGVPCPTCETPVQRIVYANNEANYCPTCQTEGRLLKDRALSRLLKSDWPKSLEELEERKGVSGEL